MVAFEERAIQNSPETLLLRSWTHDSESQRPLEFKRRLRTAGVGSLKDGVMDRVNVSVRARESLRWSQRSTVEDRDQGEDHPGLLRAHCV